MFTVEDVNSVLLCDRVNDFHSVNTSLRGGLDYVLLDFVKVRRTVNGFSFTVDNSLWSGGFYLTTVSGEYIPLTSSDYSYSDGVLSVTVDETDVVLVLYCSSFYTVFSLQYLDCRLDSLMSVVNEINLTVDDFTSLNGTAITDSDISVSDSVVTCRSNTFYKGIVELDDVATIIVDTDSLIAGSPSQTVTLLSSEDISGVTVKYDNVSEFVEFTDNTGSFQVDLSEHLTTDDFVFKALFKGIVFNLSAPVSILTVNSSSALKQALSLKIGIIEVNHYIESDDNVYEIDYDLTLICNGQEISDKFKIKEGVTFVVDEIYRGVDPLEFEVGENTNVTFKNCTFLEPYPPIGRSIIFANEDLTNTNSKILIDNCTFVKCEFPVIFFDGELEIKDSIFQLPLLTEDTNVFEPCFIHMTAGELTIHNTLFQTMNTVPPNPRPINLGGYNLACILFGEDTTFNGVNATEISKGAPSLTQYGITSEMNVYYDNGGETVHLTDGFYVAVEDKKIKNIKED